MEGHVGSRTPVNRLSASDPSPPRIASNEAFMVELATSEHDSQSAQGHPSRSECATPPTPVATESQAPSSLTGDTKTLSSSKLTKFRTAKCLKKFNHIWKDCDFSHARHIRRDTFLYVYSPILCKYFSFHQEILQQCTENMNCTNCHSKEEVNYHPLRYKTVQCRTTSTIEQCPRVHCPYWHSSSDKSNMTQDMENAILATLGLLAPDASYRSEDGTALANSLSNVSLTAIILFLRNHENDTIRDWVMNVYNRHAPTSEVAKIRSQGPWQPGDAAQFEEYLEARHFMCMRDFYNLETSDPVAEPFTMPSWISGPLTDVSLQPFPASTGSAVDDQGGPILSPPDEQMRMGLEDYAHLRLFLNDMPLGPSRRSSVGQTNQLFPQHPVSTFASRKSSVHSYVHPTQIPMPPILQPPANRSRRSSLHAYEVDMHLFNPSTPSDDLSFHSAQIVNNAMPKTIPTAYDRRGSHQTGAGPLIDPFTQFGYYLSNYQEQIQPQQQAIPSSFYHMAHEAAPLHQPFTMPGIVTNVPPHTNHSNQQHFTTITGPRRPSSQAIHQ